MTPICHCKRSEAISQALTFLSVPAHGSGKQPAWHLLSPQKTAPTAMRTSALEQPGRQSVLVQQQKQG